MTWDTLSHSTWGYVCLTPEVAGCPCEQAVDREAGLLANKIGRMYPATLKQKADVG